MMSYDKSDIRFVLSIFENLLLGKKLVVLVMMSKIKIMLQSLFIKVVKCLIILIGCYKNLMKILLLYVLLMEWVINSICIDRDCLRTKFNE